MVAFIIFMLILSILIIVHEFGHFITAKRLGVRVEEFSLGFGPRLFSKKKGDTDYSINLFPLGGYVKMSGDNLEEFKGQKYEYLSKPPWARAKIILFGPLLNYILGFLCFWVIFVAGYPTLTAKVGGLIDGFGAKDSGIQVGDKITSIDGKKIEYWEDLQKIIYTQKNAKVVKLSVLRADKELSIEVKIKEKNVDDILGQKRNVGLLGITPEGEFVKVKHGIIESFFLSFRKTYDLTVLTYKALGMMITGKMSLRDSVTGPLGMFFITSQAASQGIIAILHLVALLNISLCIFNLLPLPVLDGGHLVLLIIEKIRGRYLSLKSEQVIAKIGFSFIITLAVVITYNDMVRLFGDKIAKWFGKL